jgi:hypothetical protein
LATAQRVARIAEVAGLPACTVHRILGILGELVELGWVRVDKPGGHPVFGLGPALMRFTSPPVALSPSSFQTPLAPRRTASRHRPTRQTRRVLDDDGPEASDGLGTAQQVS